MNKKRLLFTAYNMGIGGIETALIELLKNINYQLYEVTLVLEKKEGIFLKNVPKEVLIIEILVNENKNVFVRKSINLFRKLKWAIFNYHKYNFSCCYATYSLSGNVISRLSSKNSAIYIHNDYTYIYDDVNLRSFFYKRKILKFKHIVFVSNESRQNFLNKFPELDYKTHVINNLINVKKIRTLAKEKTDIITEKSTKYLVYIGRLEEHQKKVSRLLNMFFELEKLLKIKLIIVGSGPEENLYKQMVKESKSLNVTFVGAKTNPYPFFKISDYLILTSDYEGYPVTYSEAIILHKPIITTFPVSDQFVDINKYGFVISKDIKKMGKEIQKIINNNQKIKFNINMETINEQKLNKFIKLVEGEK